MGETANERGESAWASWLLTAAFFAGITLASRHGGSAQAGYLFFHVLVEIFSVIVACGIYMIAWNSRRLLDDGFFLFLGVAYLCVAFFDLCHTITYQGMGLTLRLDPALHPLQDPAIEFWIAARYMESLALCLAPLLIGRPQRPYQIMLVWLGLAGVLFASIYWWQIFPACFVRGVGLTRFKVGSEYVISGIIAGGIILLWQRRASFAPRVFRLLLASMLVTVLAEMCFTLYRDMFGIFNIWGHYCKLISFYLIYRAAIQTSLEEPYSLLFRRLKQNELILAAERDFISAVLDHAAALVLVADPAGRIVRFNRAWANLSDPVPAGLGERAYWELFIPDHERAEAAARHRRLIETGRPESAEGRWLTAKGETRLIDWRYTVGGQADGEGAYVVALGVDITERRRAEVALVQAERMAVVGDLAAGVAHHFNNLHTTVLGYLELTLEGHELSERDRKRLQIIRAAVAQANGITDKLMRYTDRGRPREEFGLHEAAFEALALIEAAVADDQVVLIRELAPTPPLVGSRSDLTQLIVNLLLNAWHALMERPRREIRLRVWQEGGRVGLLVADTGCGIPREALGRVFNPMFSLKGEHAPLGSPQAAVRGAGLGLSICERIVRDHGGEIRLESIPEVGTSATCWFPLPEKAAPAMAAGDSAAGQGDGSKR